MVQVAGKLQYVKRAGVAARSAQSTRQPGGTRCTAGLPVATWRGKPDPIQQEKPGVATKLEARVSEHDRQIAAIRKLILQGMKMINSMSALQRKTEAGLLRLEGQQEATRQDLRELAASQRKTDAQLQSFIRSMERGRNGHSKQPSPG